MSMLCNAGANLQFICKQTVTSSQGRKVCTSLGLRNSLVLVHAGDLPFQPLPAYSAAGFAWQVTEKAYPREVSGAAPIW